ncbi:hypothetical protein FE257_011183 [Aspergillus nanangensis]|uniref:Diaminohydroxyphosphoribosylamino-pyrimidine deaminase n=1 Tax=Aspergillus nanangensis TaxID=2582783 RepID=A0AAD4CHN0_ASPNN|nr:hypothetical protein FE257_011183 [Aspergillus nanangensis]
MEELTNFLTSIGQEVEDAEEEAFLLFAQDIPSANLGFVDARASTVDISIHGQDYTIHQSPTLLSSSRAGGTTGAVLWKITPLFAEWISATNNPLRNHDLLNKSSTIVELGCGISGLIALTLASSVGHYIATDQDYVQRLLRANLDENAPSSSQPTRKSKGSSSKKKQPPPSSKHNNNNHPQQSNITFTTLDWELDVAASLKDSLDLDIGTEDTATETETDPTDKGFDLLLSCDCIYNDALIAPLVRTCADICGLRPAYTTAAGAAAESSTARKKPTVCIIAQQQRSPEVFEAWLQETMEVFHVWRVRDEVLGSRLKLGGGFLVHVLVLRGEE